MCTTVCWARNKPSSVTHDRSRSDTLHSTLVRHLRETPLPGYGGSGLTVDGAGWQHVFPSRQRRHVSINPWQSYVLFIHVPPLGVHVSIFGNGGLGGLGRTPSARNRNKHHIV